jgi:hypothetical protein
MLEEQEHMDHKVMEILMILEILIRDSLDSVLATLEINLQDLEINLAILAQILEELINNKIQISLKNDFIFFQY